MRIKKENKYTERNIKKVFEKLISRNKNLENHFLKEVDLENYSLEANLPYCDIGIISKYIVDRKIKNKTFEFEVFFENAEQIYCNSDDYVKTLIVIGLFEGIQNMCGNEIEYHYSFKRWLGEESQKAWNRLINFWEREN